MKKIILLFMVLFTVWLMAKPDRYYRREYKKLGNEELVEKAVELTQNTNRLHKDNKVLLRKINRPFFVLKVGFILIVAIMGVGIAGGGVVWLFFKVKG